MPVPPAPRLVVEPVTAATWPLLVDLLDQGGPAARCWCALWRVGADYRHRPAEQNRRVLEEEVASGPPPGLLALRDGVPVGWCQVTPRSSLAAIDRPWRLRAVDDVPVWAVTCFYVRKGYRREGIARALLDAAVQHARASGAPAVEGYPLDGTRSPSATSTGYASTFAAAGFVEVARRSPERPVMRRTFDAT
ncbi:GNAT family N-acetyltransferase [Cellulomonas alba]|uniref:GNAT family N-acetyltransferase n=1 Tax=Cellulomonas alba TaxID=3053467 RepID=A0ABT7SHJ3_9CELL|nr:GNAT family N-acetyltransferase [Cellulomonas alba]MDM7854999.1 GNAT family N-acetyltransferase [Cellulomonas alba]